LAQVQVATAIKSTARNAGTKLAFNTISRMREMTVSCKHCNIAASFKRPVTFTLEIQS